MESVAVLLSPLLLILIFFITRWFWLWYFKLNKVVELLEDIRWNLELLNEDRN